MYLYILIGIIVIVVIWLIYSYGGSAPPEEEEEEKKVTFAPRAEVRTADSIDRDMLISVANDALVKESKGNSISFPNQPKLRESIPKIINGTWRESSGDIYNIQYQIKDPPPTNQFDAYNDIVVASPQKGTGASGTVTGLYKGDDGFLYLSFSDTALVPIMRTNGKVLEAFGKDGRRKISFEK